MGTWNNVSWSLDKPVYLIGFMGSGKSSVGAELSRMLQVEAVDADVYLETCERRTIADIFARDGEDAFRSMETRYLKDLSQEARIISTGGGVVKRAQNIAIMHQFGFTVYLQVTAEEAAGRISDASSRPLFRNLETARLTIEERRPLYECAADASVNTTGRSIHTVAQEIVGILEKNSLLVEN